MRALNYAGIDMADCYTAIKNIAKKRAEKVLAYKDTFINGFKAAIIRDEGKPDDEAQQLSETLWKVVEDSAGYSFNASHSYCVAIDSLYGAWLKAHHPLEFYETYINIMEEKGDKDKIIAAREEAEDFFGIMFEPLRFGQDNRQIHATDHNTLINTLGSIKGYSNTTARILFEASKVKHKTFIDLLAYLDRKGVKEAKYMPLILIDYFTDFGNQKELIRISDAWNFLKQGDAKSVRKDSVVIEEIYHALPLYTNGVRKDGSDAASYTFETPDKVIECLRYIEQLIRDSHLSDIDMKLRIKNSIDILGHCDVRTGKPEDRRRLLITDIFELKSDKHIWAYRIATRSLGSGKNARLTIRVDDYQRRPFSKGDLIVAKDVYKNKAGYWYLTEYTLE